MGLCKCEQKKVTNLFCFEHRVNVCEFCLVSGHPKCIVKTYLQWLKDSDYEPVCTICNTALDTPGDCVRLTCLHVFHCSCLNDMISRLPPTITPAGYECPCCRQCIFPLPNQGGLIAETLRRYLSMANWAQSEFGNSSMNVLHSVGNSNRSPDNFHSNVNVSDDRRLSYYEGSKQVISPSGKLLDSNLDVAANQFRMGEPVSMPPVQSQHQVSVSSGKLVQMASGADSDDHQRHQRHSPDIGSYYKAGGTNSVHLFDDDDKHKRRGAFTWLAKLMKSRSVRLGRGSSWLRNRVLFALLMLMVVFVLFSALSRWTRNESVEGDILLDPHMNPNIHVEKYPPLLRRRGDAHELPHAEAPNLDVHLTNLPVQLAPIPLGQAPSLDSPVTELATQPADS